MEKRGGRFIRMVLMDRFAFFPLPLFWSFGSWLARRVVERRRGGGEILCVNYEEGIWFGRVLLFRLNLGICEQVKRRELKFSNLYIF